MNEELSESTVPENQAAKFDSTIKLVRALSENKYQRDPTRPLPTREKIVATARMLQRFTGGMKLESFDGVELVSFMSGKKCKAHPTGVKGQYSLEWEGGKFSRVTHRDLELAFVRT